MLIWNGLGLLVVVIAVVCNVVTAVAVGAVTGDHQYFTAHGWPHLVAFGLAAAVVWPVGRAINRKRAQSEVEERIGPGSTRRVVPNEGAGHTLFFLPMEYWAFVLVLIGACFALKYGTV